MTHKHGDVIEYRDVKKDDFAPFEIIATGNYCRASDGYTVPGRVVTFGRFGDGVHCAGSAAIYRTGFLRVSYDMDGARHGMSFKLDDMDGARAYFERITAN